MKPASQHGFALILVLWLALALAATALCFGQVAVLGYRTRSGVRANLQCRHTEQAAAVYVKALLATVEAGEMPELESEEVEEIPVGGSAFWLLAPIWNESPELSYGLVSEAGKLNLNTASKAMLQALPGMTEALAAAIVDWRDEDAEPQPYGAEDETYSRKKPPYRARNAPFDSIEELLLVEGMTEDILYGKDRNRNGLVDPWEGDGAGSSLTDYGIYHLVTVHSAEPNETGGGGEGRTNVTDAQALRRFLTRTFDAQTASRAESAGPYRSVLEFAARSGLEREQFERIAQELTMSDEAMLPGLVNVNVAPLAVLRCLPGIGDGDAEKLIDYRVANSGSLTSIAWVLDALGNDCARELGPWVTTRTYQISADVVAVADYRRAVRRARLVFDLSSGSPLLVARRDQSGMAWPLGEDLWNEWKTESLADSDEGSWTP
ncbi:MAG: helix-hairpin-helix domain-containing protein [Lentisphaeria bacterium]|jgi:DNA uptake protein ComE-like DNA-binding protein|nr:helix-hairpin-helix domain-containing protein [Lentisphaeria bacterium]